MNTSDLKGKKLLVLAGNDVHCKVVQAAKELGVYTIVADYLPLESSPAKKIADEYWNISTGDIDNIFENCKQTKVDGVLNFCIDTVQIHYQQIADKLGVPCIATFELFDIFTNKRKFKNYCKQHGVDVIPEYSKEDIEQDNVIFPILIKPSDSRGSRGITVCYTKDDVPNALKIAKNESRENVALIERYMYGTEDMSVVYMVIAGEPYLVKFGDRITGHVEDGLQCQQMATILPSNKHKEFEEKVEPNIKSMIKSTGVQFGVFFFQGFWENGRLFLYDPGLRFPGSEFDVVTRDVTGFDSMKAFVEFAVTGNTSACYGNPKEAYNYNNGTCLILSISCKPGTIVKFDGFEDVANMAEVKSARQIYKTGAIVPPSHDVRQRVAEFLAYLKDRKSVQPFIEKVYNTLQILDENGNDMIVSKVKYDNK